MKVEHSEDDFQIPPSPKLPLGREEVHVWKARLDAEFLQPAALWSILSQPERDRANNFHFSRDQNRFIVCRALLRILIAVYLDRNPVLIQFTCNQYGKPYLDEEVGEEAFRFNVSHSHEMVLYAFGRGREIGVDIERIVARQDELQIAERFFSASEFSALRALPADLQTEAFFLCWTRKEAFVKARGEGLSLPLDEFTVSLVPGEPARLLCVKGNPDELQRWSMRNLNPGPGYGAAVVVEGNDCNLKCWAFPHG